MSLLDRIGIDLPIVQAPMAGSGGTALTIAAMRGGAVAALLAALLSPDRWLLWLGILFVLSVYHFPAGVVGRLRARRAAAKGA